MNVRSALEIEGLAVVDVEGAFGVAVLVENDDQREGVVSHQAAATTWAVTTGNDVASLHQHRDLLKRCCNGVRLARSIVDGIVEVVVVVLIVSEVDIDACLTFFSGWLGE